MQTCNLHSRLRSFKAVQSMARTSISHYRAIPSWYGAFFQPGSKRGEFIHKFSISVVNTELCMAMSSDEENMKKMCAESFFLNCYQQQQGLRAKSKPLCVNTWFTAHEHWSLRAGFYLWTHGDSPRSDVQKIQGLHLRSSTEWWMLGYGIQTWGQFPCNAYRC